jgi:hypothetical protein
MVRETLDKMLKGEFNRFDVFSGEIKDNKGNVVVPAGEKMEQNDMDQFLLAPLGWNANTACAGGLKV